MDGPELYTIWKGSFLNRFKYYVYPLPCTFGPEQIGNFIFAKLVNNEWTPVYIGEGDLHIEANMSSAVTCAKIKGATHFLAHLNTNHNMREKEVVELLSRYGHLVYKPVGCNVPPEGVDPSKLAKSRFSFWK